jgi:hypothetical protein
MAVSRAMRRLQQLLELQEEQHKSALDTALAELKQLDAALKATGEQDGRGRRLVQASIGTGEILDRLTGLEESRLAVRRRAALKPRKAEIEAGVNARRQEFLEKRTERRKVETLIQRAEAEDMMDADRRQQRELDDSFLRKAGHE